MKKTTLLSLFLFMIVVSMQGQTTHYVKENGTGNGSSWTNASNDLQAIINSSNDGDEIWVAEGTYTPTLNTSFSMKEGVKMYGGFPNSGNPTMAERDYSAHITILQANGNRVITNDNNGLTNASVLDGFTVTGAKNIKVNGGGMYNKNVSPTIKNCTFSNNTILSDAITKTKGIGMYNEEGSPIITNCIFDNNSSNSQYISGGGISNFNSSPIITNCTFVNNRIEHNGYGGGIANDKGAQPKIINCIIKENGARWGGGVLNTEENTNPQIINCLITKNYTNYGGGGIYNVSLASCLILNCTIVENRTFYGGGIRNSRGAFSVIYNTIILKNIATGGGQNSISVLNTETPGVSTIKNSLLDGNYTESNYADPANHNITTNLQATDIFVDFSAKDYHLKAGTPVTDGGSKELYNTNGGNTSNDKDLGRFHRLPACDISMGAYQFQSALILEASVSAIEPEICPGGEAQFTVSGTTDADIVYGFDNGTTTQSITLTGGTATITHSNTVSDITIKIISVSKNGCDKIINKTATVTTGGTLVTPTITTPITYTYGDTATALTATATTSNTLQWYTTETSTTATSTAPIPNTRNVGTTSYWVSQTSPKGCESNRVKIDVIVNKKPLTATLSGTISKIYDGTTTATISTNNYVLLGVLSGDTVSSSNPTLGVYDTKETGTNKKVTVNGISISGVDAGNYTLTTTTISATIGEITAKEIAVTLTGTVSKIYDGTTSATLSASNYILSGVLSGDTVSSSNPTLGVYDTKEAGTNKKVTVNGISISGIDARNYTLTTATISATIGEITKANITGVTISDTSFVYDGSTKSLTINGGLPNGVSVSYINNSQTEVGVYSVTAEINGGNNYNHQTLTATLTITKANITGISFNDNSFIFDENSKSLAIDGVLPNGVNVNYTNNSQTEVGVYSVTADIDGGNNYNHQTLTATLTITKADITGITFDDKTFEFDGSTKSLIINGILPNKTSVNYVDNAHSQIGDYTVTANIDGGNNYNDLTLTAVLSILPIQVGKVNKAVTPNGDGFNDFWYIGLLENQPNNRVELYNRWGQPVFAIDNYNNKDRVFTGVGNINGTGELPEATYFYKIFVGDIMISTDFLELRR